MVEYGLDKELKAKMESKYDPEMEKAVIGWIEAVSGETQGEQTFAEWLRSGEVLCKLANTIRPGCVKKVHKSKIPAFQHENITFFVNAARDMGVPEFAVFSSPDLFEERNMLAVVNCIYAFGGAVQVSCPDYTGPTLGIAMTIESQDKKREHGIATDQASGFATSLDVAKPTERLDARVRSSAPAPTAAVAATAAVPATVAATAKAGYPADASSPPKAPAPVAGATSAEYGLDKELKAKMDSAYDHSLESEVIGWIESIIGETKGDQSVADWLRDGTRLCALANAIRPGIVKKVHKSRIPAFQHENITFFVNAARELGVAEMSVFSSPDLYEEKNMGSVINCIYSFGGVIQVSCPEFNGPKLGVAITAESNDTKRGGGILTDQSAGFAKTMEVQRPGEHLDSIIQQ